MSSPSNASNASSVATTTSPWRDSPQRLQHQHQHQQRQSSPLATPASSFGAGNGAALFLGKSPLEPMPEALAPDNKTAPVTTNTAAAAAATTDKRASPANGFPLPSSAFSDGSSGDDDDVDEDDALGGGGGGGRAAMWGGVSATGSGSVRDFTASRAASSSRRMAERQRSGMGAAGSGGGS